MEWFFGVGLMNWSFRICTDESSLQGRDWNLVAAADMVDLQGKLENRSELDTLQISSRILGWIAGRGLDANGRESCAR